MDQNEFETLLNEVSLSQLTGNKLSKTRLRVDNSTVFIIVPSPDIALANAIYEIGFLLTNCEGVVSPNSIIKIGNMRVNGRAYYYNLKKELMSSEQTGKKIKVLNSIPEISSAEKQAKFYFYDLSAYANAIDSFKESYSYKIIAQFLFNNISKVYRGLKNRNPGINHELLLLTKHDDNMVAEILKDVKTNLPQQFFKDLEIYDNFAYFANLKGVIAPVFGKKNGENTLLFNNLRRMLKSLETKSGEETSEEEGEETKGISKDSPEISGIVDAIKDSDKEKQVDDDGNIKVSLDKKQLSRVLKEYEIDDPDLLANIKKAIEKYIKEKGENPSEEEAEIIVLRTINYTINGTEEINEEYLNNPKKLVSKLTERQTHRTPLDMPSPDSSIIDPNDVVNLEYTTGAWRQSEEFEETIHENVKKLFETLEDTNDQPIKIKNIDHEMHDDDSNRFIRYTITLQNTSGGKKEPYQVQFDVPGIVNDRYFKIKGTNYVMGNQHFMKPVTKTVRNDVRVLSNYAIVRLGLEDVMFNPSEIEDILEYTKIRYANIIKDLTDDYCQFNDDSIIYLAGEKVFEDNESSIKTNDKGKLEDNEGNELDVGRYEFQYEVVLNKIQEVNPDDKLSKKRKSIPYVSIYISSVKIPFIYYLWEIKGLLTSLNDLGIDYEITDDFDRQQAEYVIAQDDGNYLVINPENIKQRYVCNGLLSLKPKEAFKNFEDTEEIQKFIEKNFGSKSTFYLNNQTQNMIDPITKELLEYEDLPTSLPNLLSTHCLDVLFNDKPNSMADMKIYRSRMSEVILNIMYSQITMAHNRYREKVNFGDEEAKLEFQSDFVINDISQEPGVLEPSKPINPIEEIELASRTYKTGPGGVKNKVSFKASHRNTHPSQIGSMSANTTNESDKVGLTVSHTLTPMIMNAYGSYGYKDKDAIDGWQAVSANEALVPFQNQVDSDRMIMAARHTGQVTPTSGNEPPYVGTGAEFFISQLSSSRFVQNAKKNGKIVEVKPNQTIKIEYEDGNTETLDIMPRQGKTKMGGSMLLEMETLNEGDQVKKNQPVAWTKNFNKEGIFSPGKNLFMAVMNYAGYSHEDAYCVTENVAESMKRDFVREVPVIIPPDAKILKLEDKLRKVENNEILVEFSYQDNLENYLQATELGGEEEEDIISNFAEGEDSIQSRAKEGEIVDIKVFINNKGSVDKQVVNLHKELVNKANEVRDALEASAEDEDEKIKATDNMDLSFIKTGGHKMRGGNEFKGARIVYYIRQEIDLTKGDKLATRYGAKGVISRVIPKEQVPYSAEENQIDLFISPTGVFSRKNIAMIKELYLGKIIYYLNQKAVEMAQDTNIKTDKIAKMVYDIYDLLASDEVKKSVENRISSLSAQKFRNAIKNGDLKFYFTIPPFKNVEFEDLRTAADHLDIALDEKIYMPEFNMWTKEEVPVGITYVQALEHTADFYSNMRSMGKYQGITGQAAKGKAVEGGQSIGQLDMNALLSINADSMLDELTTLRSDEHQSKRQVINNIINDGQSGLPKSIKRGETGNLMDVYMRGMGLDIT